MMIIPRTLITMNCVLSNLFLSILLFQTASAFAPSKVFHIHRVNSSQLYADATVEENITVDPKEVAKVFGRLAEKYIMLDASGGLCCYSACSGEIFVTE